MRWPILALFLLSACVRGPTEVKRAMDTCAKFESPAAECRRGVADSVRYVQQLGDDALQPRFDDLSGQVRPYNDPIEALHLECVGRR